MTNRVTLTPVAIREGHLLADRLFGGGARQVDYDLIPTAVFTTPELGTVGMSETRGAKDPACVDIYQTCFRPMKATLAGGSERM